MRCLIELTFQVAMRTARRVSLIPAKAGIQVDYVETK
jgi:hypothetical protein